MESKYLSPKIEIWGGIECTINRVLDIYFDQLHYSGHYERDEDIEFFAELGIKKMRYPILWEKHEPELNTSIDWDKTEKKLNRLKELGIEPIAGLVHHGSGPKFANIFDEKFPQALANYAAKVAEKFPWIEYYTPINEPLTTARFCGLYGIWHPHKKDDKSFAKILVNECKATVLSMKAICKVNPNAKLIQTEDLGKTHSTVLMQYQADFENQRRWLAFNLLCGKVTPVHPMWQYLIWAGIDKEELLFFIDHTCKPFIIGFNHYLTSERYLDENIESYPLHTHGNNCQHSYADVEAIRVDFEGVCGIEGLIKEAWDYFKLPIAITEVQLHCTREEQLRWFSTVWKSAHKLVEDGIPIKAITTWAMLGSYGWNNLLIHDKGDYESGVFDVRSGSPRATALTKMIKAYAANENYHHPVLNNEGWWLRDSRIIYPSRKKIEEYNLKPMSPLLITGRTGTLGSAFSKICTSRGITHLLLGRQDLNITDPAQIEHLILETKPWAIVNTAGFVKVDEAENEAINCFMVNAIGPENLALICRKHNVRLLTFSSDLVFNGEKTEPYSERDKVSPLNIYGHSKAIAEQIVLKTDPSALIIRTSAFFGPWDAYNFATHVLFKAQNNQEFKAANDIFISPTYLPDLVNTSLDLLLDQECGVWHLANKGELSWAEFAYKVVNRGGYNANLIIPSPLKEIGFKATRPRYSVLKSEHGLLLPSLDDALSRYFSEQELLKL